MTFAPTLKETRKTAPTELESVSPADQMNGRPIASDRRILLFFI